MTETPAKTKGVDDSKANATTVAKKDTRVPNVGRRKKMPTKGRYFIAKDRGEGMASKDKNAESDSEFLLLTKNDLTFAATDSLLVDPNVWIADSGATSDTMAHEIGMTNKKMASEEENITDASGETVGDLKRVICNKQGK